MSTNCFVASDPLPPSMGVCPLLSLTITKNTPPSPHMSMNYINWKRILIYRHERERDRDRSGGRSVLWSSYLSLSIDSNRLIISIAQDNNKNLVCMWLCCFVHIPSLFDCSQYLEKKWSALLVPFPFHFFIIPISVVVG